MAKGGIDLDDWSGASADEWLPEIEPLKNAPVVSMDGRPLAERSKLSDRGLVDFRRCDLQCGLRTPV
jgi:hypothetical protein